MVWHTCHSHIFSISHSTFVYIDDVEYKHNFNHSGKSYLPDTLPRRSFHDQDFDRGHSKLLLSLTPAYSARLDFLPLAQLISLYLCFRPRMTRSPLSPHTHTHTHTHKFSLTDHTFFTLLHTAPHPLLFHEHVESTSALRILETLILESFFQQPLLRLALKPGDCLSARFPPPPPLPMRRRRRRRRRRR